MQLRSRSILTAALVLAVSPGLASGGIAESVVIEIPPSPSASPWVFEASLYGWLVGIDGTTGVGPLTSTIDASFSDIFDYLNMAAAMRLEARNDRWGVIADGFYADLGASGNPPYEIYEHVDVSMKEFLGELSVAYRVYEGPRGFIDVYAGIRYNSLDMDFSGSLDSSGLQAISERASGRIVDGILERADAIAEPKAAAYKAAAATERAATESTLSADIEAEANGRVKRNLEKQLLEIRRRGGLDAREIASAKIMLAVTKQRTELAVSTARLEVAQLRSSVESGLQAEVGAAKSDVQQAKKKLAAAINKQLASRIPTEVSAKEDWVDPIVGVRAQWSVTDKWFLAGRSDIGGFSVGSDLAWSVQATVGYNFNERYSLELGFRYLDTDYTHNAFTYDIANGGIYTSLNAKF
jgi:hypothetical protein